MQKTAQTSETIKETIPAQIDQDRRNRSDEYPVFVPSSQSSAETSVPEHLKQASSEWRRLYEAVRAAVRRDRAGLSDTSQSPLHQ